MSGLDIAEAYLQSLLKTERSRPDELATYQDKLLQRLATFAAGETPFYDRLGAPPADVSSASAYWRSLPFVTRQDLVRDFNAFRPRSFSSLHGIMIPLSTGGSTGPAVQRNMSSLESIARLLASYRMYDAWQLDQSRPMFVLRKTIREDTKLLDTWGYAWRDRAKLGKRIWIDVTTPPEQQLEAMAGQGSVYVNTLASNIMRLSLAALASGVSISIPYIVSVGEYLAPEVRAVARRAFGSTIIDAFSSAEGGVIAIQCPHSGLYHIQQEQVLVEVIGADGQHCAESESGEAVITPLYGYATPLLRYRSGDFVVQGTACGCGRNLPTLARIVGRREHMFQFPDGHNEIPKIDRVLITAVLGDERWLLTQTGLGRAVLRHVVEARGGTQQDVLTHIASALGPDFSVTAERVGELPLTSGGKRHFTSNELAGAGRLAAPPAT